MINRVLKITVMMLGISMISLGVTKEIGVNLDLARQYYSVQVIKKFIDNISSSGGNFLHLHISDDENYGIESEILGQTTAEAKLEKGIYINKKTGKKFLSYAQLKEIIFYAKTKNIELIPEIDSPAHMKAIFELLEMKKGNFYVKNIKSDTEDEINMEKSESINFMKQLIGEVTDIFGGKLRHFHIGGDEFEYSEVKNSEFVKYINDLSDYLISKRIKPRLWNDGITKVGIDKINKEIEITYWSYDGDAENDEEKEKRRKTRVSVQELLKKGFKVLNYNSYYLYYVPKESSNLKKDTEYSVNDINKNWDLRVWDGKNSENAVKNEDNIIGAAISIWGEGPYKFTDSEIQKYSEPLVKTFILKAQNYKKN